MMIFFSRITLMLITKKKKRPTISKGEAVHDGHPIEPVLVAGVPHREDARPITQQRALQPARNIPCNHRRFLLFHWGWAPIGEWIMPEKDFVTFDFGPLLLRALHCVHREVRGHVDREVAACSGERANVSHSSRAKLFLSGCFFFFWVSLSLPWTTH